MSEPTLAELDPGRDASGVAQSNEPTIETGRPEPARAARPSRIHALDLLRFACALMVVAFHLTAAAAFYEGVDPNQAFTRPVYQATRYGWVGVMIFFMISGFVICMSSWGRTVEQFFTSRVVRLYPAYLFAVPLTAIAIWCFHPAGATQPLTLMQVLGNLTMMHQFVGIQSVDGVYWSLFIELKFYIIFALVVRAGLTYRRVLWFSIAWLVLAAFAHGANDSFVVAVIEPRFAPYFVVGIMLYLMHRFGPNLVLWCVLGVAFIFGAQTLDDLRRESHADTGFSTLLIVYAVGTLILVGVALGWFDWVRWRGCAVLGALTFPLYLLHNEIGSSLMHQLSEPIPRMKPMLALVLVIVFALAYGTHRLVERPVSRLLRDGLKRGFAAMHAATDGARPRPRTGERG
nr:acyltransferase [Dactylosporangium thailandense]